MNSNPSLTPGSVDYNIIIHNGDNASNSYYQCKICMLLFGGSGELERHIQLSGNDIFECTSTDCLKRFHNRYSVERHELYEEHGERRCRVCNLTSESPWRLKVHATEEQHAALQCRVKDCFQFFADEPLRKTHERCPHNKDHYRIETSNPLACIECNAVLPSQHSLNVHANLEKHSPFRCACGITFARVDVLHRHIKSYSKEMPEFPCTFCKFHRGRRGFRRRDHLVQHLEGYHKFDSNETNRVSPVRREASGGMLICSHAGCEYHREKTYFSFGLGKILGDSPFSKQSELTKHLKKVHDESLFPCNVYGCDKVGGKGYTRQKDLMKHQASKHPELE